METQTFVSPSREDVQANIMVLTKEKENLESRLSALDEKVWLSPAEEYERKKCQKLKLLKKDQIHHLVQQLQ